jgi:hypothetical protein
MLKTLWKQSVKIFGMKHFEKEVGTQEAEQGQEEEEEQEQEQEGIATKKYWLLACRVRPVSGAWLEASEALGAVLLSF